MTLSRSGASSPPSMLKDSITRWVSLYSTPVATSKGRRISTESQLKKSWTVAPANALEVRGDNILEHVPNTISRDQFQRFCSTTILQFSICITV